MPLPLGCERSVKILPQRQTIGGLLTVPLSRVSYILQWLHGSSQEGHSTQRRAVPQFAVSARRVASGGASCRVWSDAEGRLLNPAHGQQSFQFQVERTMRLFYRLRYTHHRYMATADPTVDTLNTALQRSTSIQRPGNGAAPAAPTVDGTVADASVFGSGVGAHGMQFGELETLRQSVCDDRVREEMEQLVEALSNGDSPAGLFLDLRCVPRPP